MQKPPEMQLSESLRSAAHRSGNEWGWKPDVIPRVIAKASSLGLLSIGGQLKFLPPERIYECYWVEVDVLTDEPEDLTWPERVAFSATAAERKFADICQRYDFLAEGRKAFATHLAAYEAGGGDIRDRMIFIWYLEANSA